MAYRRKISGIYILKHEQGYYIGMSIDIFSRWASHYSDIKMKKHSSKELMKLWNSTRPEEWSFKILEYVSKTNFKKECGLKGKTLENAFRKKLLIKEKEWMQKYSKTFALNQNQKHFS